MLTEALTYAESGIAVLPLEGKVPVTRLVWRGVYHATRDPAVIESWWRSGNHNVGAAIPAGHVVLDVDPRNGGDRSFARLEAEFGTLPRTRKTATGGGGFHLWFRCPGGRPRLRYPGIDVKGPGTYVVMPPSIHDETGLRYAWSPDSVPTIAPLPRWAMTEVDRRPSLVIVADMPRPARRARGLSPTAIDMLTNGVKAYGDTSRSGVFWSCLWYLIHAGWTADDVMAAARNERYRGLNAEYRDRGARHVVAQYRWALSLSGRDGLARTLQRLRAIERAIEIAAEDGAWRHRGGTNERVVLEQFVEKAKRDGSMQVAFSMPQLMLATSIGREATLRAIVTRLDPWIREVGGPAGGAGKRYALQIPADIETRHREHLSFAVPLRTAPSDVPLNHDAFVPSANGPGKGGQLILRLFPDPTADQLRGLTDQELEDKASVSRQTILDATGMAPASVHRNLTLLVKMGLIRKVARGRWRRVGAIDLDGLARSAGTAGTAERIAEEVRVRREEQRQWLRDRRAEGEESEEVHPAIRRDSERVSRDDDDWDY